MQKIAAHGLRLLTIALPYRSGCYAVWFAGCLLTALLDTSSNHHIDLTEELAKSIVLLDFRH